jgi:hypothetical protein
VNRLAGGGVHPELAHENLPIPTVFIIRYAPPGLLAEFLQCTPQPFSLSLVLLRRLVRSQHRNDTGLPDGVQLQVGHDPITHLEDQSLDRPGAGFRLTVSHGNSSFVGHPLCEEDVVDGPLSGKVRLSRRHPLGCAFPYHENRCMDST